MLNVMRKHAGSWIIKFILGAVILAFIPFGFGVYQDRREQEIASVNDLPIFLDEYNQVYNVLIEQMRRNFGDAFNEETIQMLGLKKQALDQLIDQKLLLSEAERLDVQVGDQELVDAIRNIEVFQTAGVFDSRRYEFILSRNRLSKEAFEERQKEAMLVDKLRDLITSGVKVSEPEALDWYNWSNAQVDIDYVVFTPESYQEISVSDEEIQAYYDEHKDEYKTDEQVNVRYLKFDPKDYIEAVAITEAEMQEYYDLNRDEFETPKTVEARHILFKVDPDADPEAIEAARQKAEEVLKLARENGDFAALAKEYSEGPSKDNGGYLGTFRKESMVAPFSDKAFSMQAGEISDPVKTRFGWHIIKVETVNEASTTPYDAAKAKIRRTLADESAKNLAYDDAEVIYDSTFESDDLDRIASERELTIHTTGYFPRQGPVPGVPQPAQFASQSFALEEGEISDIVELGDSFAIMQLVDRKQPEISPLESVKQRVREDVSSRKRDEKAAADAQRFLEALQGGKTWDELLSEFKREPENTGFFKRNAAIPEIGYDRAVTEAAFKLSSANRLAEDVISGQKGKYVIRFKDKKEPETAEFEKEQLTVSNRLLQQKKIKAMEKWLAQKREASQIEIDQQFIE